MSKVSLYSRASSPSVMPCRCGTGYRPQKFSSPSSRPPPSTAHAADGIGPVEDDDLDPGSPCRAHAKGHGGGVGVVPRTHILDVEHEHVEARKAAPGRARGTRRWHRRGWPPAGRWRGRCRPPPPPCPGPTRAVRARGRTGSAGPRPGAGAAGRRRGPTRDSPRWGWRPARRVRPPASGAGCRGVFPVRCASGHCSEGGRERTRTDRGGQDTSPRPSWRTPAAGCRRR